MEGRRKVGGGGEVGKGGGGGGLKWDWSVKDIQHKEYLSVLRRTNEY